MAHNGRLIGMGIDFGMGKVPLDDRVKFIADAGFDAAFCGWRRGDYLTEIAKLFKQNSLIFQSVHAPFNKVNKLWERGAEGDAVFADLRDCLTDCGEAGAPIMVSHVWIGFGRQHPNDIGIERFGKLLDHAQKCGVRVAFENTEGEKYLEYVRDQLFSHPAAGFCIDTGHEMCYNYSEDMITKYGAGGKLIATHINDNEGITGKSITWLDDAHLLPFDGVADWQGVVDRLAGVGYDGILMSELTVNSKPDRHTHDIYAHLDCEGFVKLAYERVSRIAELIK